MHSAGRRMRRAATHVVLALVLGASVAGFQFEMPDPIEMSGIPLPSGELADGVVSVRVIRGQLSNNVVDHPVEVVGADGVVRVSTNEAGRALFTDLPAGSLVRAATDLDGRRIESQPFAVPASGGIILMLVAPDLSTGGATAASGVVRPGVVAFGGASRFILELGEENLEVYYLLDIVNNGASAVSLEKPLVFELPSAAAQSTLLQGSTSQARLAGRRVEVDGPFRPGATHLEVAYFLPYVGDEMTVSQRMPSALSQLSVLAQKRNGVVLSSPQIQSLREVESEGRRYIVANGPGMSADSTLTLHVTGLPYRSTLAPTLGVFFGLAIIGIGLWSATGRGDSSQNARRERLESRRNRLFGTLVGIEEARRAGTLDETRYAARRRELVAQLDRIYRALDKPHAA